MEMGNMWGVEGCSFELGGLGTLVELIPEQRLAVLDKLAMWV